jgi:hypothetical protein
MARSMMATYAASTRCNMMCSSAMARARSYCSGVAPSPQNHPARHSISAEVAGSRGAIAVSPWRNAFVRARFLPCAVLGPVLLVALLRPAAIFFAEVILDLRKASSEGRCRPRNSASLRRRRRRGVEFILGGLQHAGRTYAVERAPTGVLVGGGHLAAGAVEVPA